MRRCFTIGIILCLAFAAATGTARAESDFYKEFKAYYNSLLSDLSRKPPAEVAEISDFVYQKDLVTFEFRSGKIYFLRKVLGRPTTAIFLGNGHASMTVPVHVERHSLFCCSSDSVVAEDFDVCFIRMSDDFDLKLREKYEFEETSLAWRDFNKAQQGEFFFKPILMHDRDNLFQLLRSAYERDEDGYFYADFNRYVFTYDPNRAEEVEMAFEYEGGDQKATAGAVLQRMDRGITEDHQVSDIQYLTSVVDRTAEFRMKGLDGKTIDEARCKIRLLLNQDSARFVSLFLHYNLDVDSVYFNGQSVDFHRRRDFRFIGVILPEYAHRGDTLDLEVWYHGRDYGTSLPFVADPAATPIKLTFDIPSGFNYLMPAKGEEVAVGGGRIRFEVEPQQPYANFVFQPMSGGFDTIQVISEMGLPLNFIKSSAIDKKHFKDFVPDDIYQDASAGAFNYLTGLLGPPLATFEIYIYPDSLLTMPGLIEVPQVHQLVDGTGGIRMLAGKEVARQWFGALVQPASARELWIIDAVPDYLSLMYVNDALGKNIFFGELASRRNYVYTVVENDDDVPLGLGNRVPATLRTAKGVWVIHMLRNLMTDLEALNNPESRVDPDRNFLRFIRALATTINNQEFTNTGFIELAERFYGEPLDWFFHHWLYRSDFPEYQVDYNIEQRDDGFYIGANVEMKGMGEDFTMPVIMRVEGEDGQSTYHRHLLSGRAGQFELGPFAVEPKEMQFNELWSVLSKDRVDKK